MPYELSRCFAGTDGHALPQDLQPATFAAQERMFEQLRLALEKVHFLFGPKADSLMHALRHLLGRAQPTMMEVEILHGLARQLLHGKGDVGG